MYRILYGVYVCVSTYRLWRALCINARLSNSRTPKATAAIVLDKTAALPEHTVRKSVYLDRSTIIMLIYIYIYILPLYVNLYK